jgi:copper chaperone
MVELKVKGMSCAHCVSAVTDALAAVPGVTAVESVNLDNGLAAVRGTASADALVAAVKQAGYEAEAIP